MIEQIRASFASLVVVALCSGAAQAAVTITAEEIGGDVVFSTCGGSLNLSGLTKSADTSGGGYIAPQTPEIIVGPSGNSTDADQYIGTISRPADFGTGNLAGPTSGYGGLVGPGPFQTNTLIVPDGYSSGSPLGVSAMTFSGATFASLGLTPGIYTWSWSGDSITLDIGGVKPCSPVTWYLNAVVANGPMAGPSNVYGDGAVNYPVTGFFDYDADNNIYSNVNISTPFYNWTDADLAVFFVQDARHMKVFDSVTGDGLVLSFLSDLTNAGGTVTLRTGFAAVDCLLSECGSIEKTPVGAPVTWTLENVTTSDNATWTGTFGYNSVSNTYSAINIISSVGGFPNPVNEVSVDALGFGCTDPATATGVTLGPAGAGGFTIFCMDFVAALTEVGGEVDLVTGGVGWGNPVDFFNITGGKVTADLPATGAYYMTGSVSTTPPSVTVDIDIQSGYAGNALHPHHDGSLGPSGIASLPDDVVSVSVLGSLISAGDPIDFDTDDIDAATLAFGPGAGATDPGTPPQYNQNVDGDGIDDATFGFLMSDSGISCGETSATLSGETTGGQEFQGSDSIVTDCDAVCHN